MVKQIEWSHIVHLHKLQDDEGLRLQTNSRRHVHVQFQQQKMKVRLAAQTLSASVGSAFQFMSTNNINGFGDTSGTQKFVSMVDRLFDIFNSRSVKASGYKHALTASTYRKVLPFLLECKFLLNITDNLRHRRRAELRYRRTGLRGVTQPSGAPCHLLRSGPH